MTNKQKRHALKVARKWLRKKVEMERPFVRELRSYFYQSSKTIARGGQVPSIEDYLEKQYKRVVRVVSGFKIKQEEEEEDYGLNNALIALIFGRAVKQAIIIDKTTAKTLRRAEELARQELADDGILLPTQSVLNRTTANIFRTLNRSRPAGIATSETQILTEEVRGVMAQTGEDMMNDAIFEVDKDKANRAADLIDSAEAQEVADQIGITPPAELFPAMALLRKTWVTMGDSKVRPTHQAANFQTVPIGEPFTVGGFQMMRPGDTSMGAPIKEVANCRCSSVIL